MRYAVVFEDLGGLHVVSVHDTKALADDVLSRQQAAVRGRCGFYQGYVAVLTEAAEANIDKGLRPNPEDCPPA